MNCILQSAIKLVPCRLFIRNRYLPWPASCRPTSSSASLSDDTHRARTQHSHTHAPLSFLTISLLYCFSLRFTATTHRERPSATTSALRPPLLQTQLLPIPNPPTRKTPATIIQPQTKSPKLNSRTLIL